MCSLISLVLVSMLQMIFLRNINGEDCSNPRNWCKNEETAKKCGMTEYCTHAELLAGNIGPVIIDGQDYRKVDASPVQIGLYYESYCPGCLKFMLRQLWPAFRKLWYTGIMNVTLVPYGNAKEKKVGNTYQFTCQHGPKECTGNIIEACAIHLIGNQTVYMPFVMCTEVYKASEVIAKKCAKLLHFNYDPIHKCVNGRLGNILEHQMGVKTRALQPPHKYVPWITVNGKHSAKIQSGMSTNALKYICGTYQGTKPAPCKKTDTIQDVCYRDADY